MGEGGTPRGVKIPCPHCRSNVGVDPGVRGYNHDHQLSFVDGMTSSVGLVAVTSLCSNPDCPAVKAKLQDYTDCWRQKGLQQPPDAPWTVETVREWSLTKEEFEVDGKKKTRGKWGGSLRGLSVEFTSNDPAVLIQLPLAVRRNYGVFFPLKEDTIGTEHPERSRFGLTIDVAQYLMESQHPVANSRETFRRARSLQVDEGRTAILPHNALVFYRKFLCMAADCHS